jgi:hypothetical protein
MRLAALLTSLCLLPGVGLAQTPECRTVPSATDRLACNDKASPPNAIEKPGAVTSATVSGKERTMPEQTPGDSSTPFADMLAVENSRLDAKIKNICRGC